jgi:hypothetical protein
MRLRWLVTGGRRGETKEKTGEGLEERRNVYAHKREREMRKKSEGAGMREGVRWWGERWRRRNS